MNQNFTVEYTSNALSENSELMVRVKSDGNVTLYFPGNGPDKSQKQVGFFCTIVDTDAINSLKNMITEKEFSEIPETTAIPGEVIRSIAFISDSGDTVKKFVNEYGEISSHFVKIEKQIESVISAALKNPIYAVEALPLQILHEIDSSEETSCSLFVMNCGSHPIIIPDPQLDKNGDVAINFSAVRSDISPDEFKTEDQFFFSADSENISSVVKLKSSGSNILLSPKEVMIVNMKLKFDKPKGQYNFTANFSMPVYNSEGDFILRVECILSPVNITIK